MKPSASRFVAVRGLSYHVRTWGEPSARKLFLLHGWMDVSASFQFMVDALAGDWHVLAPDWRGFGLSEAPQDGYWFLDYTADLDALVRALARGEKIALAGHSLGANVALLYAGARPGNVSHVVALDGFGVPDQPADQAPQKLAHWLDALAAPEGFAPYRDMAAVADRLQKNNRRLSRDKAAFIAEHWAERMADGSARLRADPKHKLPFPTTYRMADMYAVWRAIAAPMLWVAGADSHIPKWLAAGGDAATEVARRFAHMPGARLVTIPDAGHMLHHDQPEAVARELETFLSTPAG
ncbi:MAG: alpha/beta hydrolase [Betaproteobacteria bacterium]|nr:alpha/beta hydrolase [Betaproteobacteria bacterium]MCC7216498.1 alpha/beta hydrolase [Burkholderiales bacterium]